jgi:hypothetical protein
VARLVIPGMGGASAPRCWLHRRGRRSHGVKACSRPVALGWSSALLVRSGMPGSGRSRIGALTQPSAGTIATVRTA